MSNTESKPALLSLRKIALELGVKSDTIVENQDAFFPVLRLGTKRYVASEAYARWRKTHLEPAIAGAESA